METVGVILASVFAGVFLVLLVAGMVMLIVLHLRSKKESQALRESMANFIKLSAETQNLQLQQLTGIIEGARSSFTGIRQDIKTSQETQAKSLAKTLKDHETAFRETIGKINGDVLLKASMQAVQALRELSALSITLKNLLVDHETPAASSELGPEEYGPSDTIYAKVSEASRMDMAEMNEAVAEAAPLYSTGMAE